MNLLLRTTALALSALLLVTACGRSEPVEVLDMDKVLDVFDRVSKGEAPAGAEVPAATELAPVEEDATRTASFLAEFGKELNAAKLSKYPIGVQMHANGAIAGYSDRNADGVKGPRESLLFKIEIDPENGRVIATQTVAGETYHRDRRYYYGGGYWSYWMYGSMWGRQRTYYSSPSRTRPRYGSMRMAPKGYHSAAVSKARAASGGARSRGGSRSFGGGK